MSARITVAQLQLLAENSPASEQRFYRSLIAQVRADAQRLADLEAENAALRSDAAEWRALQAVIGHDQRDRSSIANVLWWTGSEWRCQQAGVYDGAIPSAPTPSALLAKLDALAEARKPKAEVWRWRYRDGGVAGRFVSAQAAREWGETTAKGYVGHPVREVRNAAGDILLLREGRPIPTEGGPWT